MDKPSMIVLWIVCFSFYIKWIEKERNVTIDFFDNITNHCLTRKRFVLDQ
jgi:hypothetical protein